MLKPAINYQDELNKKSAEKAMSGNSLNATQSGYNVLHGENDKDNWHNYQYVSVSKKDKVIGFISFSRSNPGNRITEITILGFSKDSENSIIFGKDCYEGIKMMFDVFKIDSIHWTGTVGTNTEKHYDSFVDRCNGRVIGIAKRRGVNGANEYVDVKYYEILKEDWKGRKSK